MADASEENRCKYLANQSTNLHGHMYEIKMITSVVWKLVDKDDWYLATKISLARGFHDLVLEKKEDKNSQCKYRLVQIRHYKKKPAKITTKNTLLSKNINEEEFSLINLFKAYLKIIGYNQKNHKGIKADEIKDLIIFSNRGISGTNTKFFKQIEKESLDTIIGFQNEQYNKQYRIDTSIIAEFKKVVEKIKCLKHIKNNENCNACQIKNIKTIINKNQNMLRGFLEKVVFMVEQPSISDLETFTLETLPSKTLITGKISEEVKITSTQILQICYNNLYKEISEWYMSEKDEKTYLNKEFLIQNLDNTLKMLQKTTNENISELKTFLDNPSSPNNSSATEE